MAPTITVLGASARAAAFSALRAGYAPWTADLFADADLARRCPVRRVSHYPDDFESAAKASPQAPWMYTGALENYPDLVDRLAALRPLWGNAGPTLRQVRNPWLVQEALAAARLPCPAISDDPASLGPGSWLRKPRRSAGGANIAWWESGAMQRGAAAVPTNVPDFYFQEHIPGIPQGGVFVGAGGRAILLGVTRQWIGEAWTGAAGFQYSGSLGPLVLSQRECDLWRKIGDCLAGRFALLGLFGVDAIANDDGVFPVEVNPRYTASIEVLERVLGIRAVALHASACRHGELPAIRERDLVLPQPDVASPAAPPRHVAGKAVLYAPREGAAGEAFWRMADEANRAPDWPVAADLPHRGEMFVRGRPVLTIFAAGANPQDVERRLRRRAARFFQAFGRAAP